MEKVYSILSKINETIINPLIILIFAVALVYFIYGVFEYFWKSTSDPAKIKEGKNHILWGIFGMFIMISVFGLFKFLLNTLPVSENTRNNVNKVIDLN